MPEGQQQGDTSLETHYINFSKFLFIAVIKSLEK